MARTQFENLEVYQISEELADGIWFIVNAWANLPQSTIGRQLIRAADSIGANGSYKDNKRFVKMARGSLFETQHWLRRAFKRNLLTQEQVQKLKPLVDELGPRLNAYLTSIGRPNKNNGRKLPKTD